MHPFIKQGNVKFLGAGPLPIKLIPHLEHSPLTIKSPDVPPTFSNNAHFFSLINLAANFKPSTTSSGSYSDLAAVKINFL